MRACAGSLLALLIALGSGCAGAGHVSLGPPATTPGAKEYFQIQRRWSRQGLVRDDFDTALEVTATLREPEFRAAYASRFIEVFRVGPDQAPQLRQSLSKDGADTFEFHVEAATHSFDLNDFSSPRSVWRVSLVNDQGQEVLLSDAHASSVRREVDAAFYPSVGVFTRGWRLRFPRTLPDGTSVVAPATRSLTLRFAGPMGSTDLVWQLSRGGGEVGVGAGK